MTGQRYAFFARGMSQSVTRSPLAAASVFPSGVNATPRTPSESTSKVAITDAVATSQRLIVPSSLEDASSLPSRGEYNTMNKVAMPLESGSRFAQCDIPESYGPVVATGSKCCPVWREGHGPNRPDMPLQSRPHLESYHRGIWLAPLVAEAQHCYSNDDPRDPGPIPLTTLFHLTGTSLAYHGRASRRHLPRFVLTNNRPRKYRFRSLSSPTEAMSAGSRHPRRRHPCRRRRIVVGTLGILHGATPRDAGGRRGVPTASRGRVSSLCDIPPRRWLPLHFLRVWEGLYAGPPESAY